MDISSTEDGSIIGVVDGENVTIYSKNGKTYAPEDSSSLFRSLDAVSIDCSGLDTSNTTNMAEMFFYCEKLAELNIKTFDTSKVTDMISMFAGCSSLTTLDISNFNNSFDDDNINTNIMFQDCQNLNIIVANESVKDSVRYSFGLPSSCTVTVK